MWKYVTRRFRDTFERSANHFDKRPTTNVVNAVGNIPEERKKPCSGGGGPPPCPIQAWFRQKRCPKKNHRNNFNTNNNRWNFEQLNRSWIGAITWSSALALGWYTSQFIHMKIKHQLRDDRQCINVNNLIATLKPYVNCVNNRALFGNSTVKLEKILEEFTPTVHLIANEQGGVKKPPNSSSSTTPDSSTDSDLGDVLNSIENRLGLAAIESGQHQVGLNLLRSAANRHHAPAMFNLGLCYEMGLGVPINEKTAMELYKSAAALQHPGALYNLGIYYGQGRGGLTRDLETATRLLRLAAVQGQKDAVDALKALDAEEEPPRIEIDDTWLNHHNPLLLNDGIAPSPTTLFVENVLFAPAYKSKATVY